MTLDKMIFLQIFLQHLLSNIQQGLFAVKGKLTIDELANLADEFIASLPAACSVNEVTFTSQTEQLAELFAKRFKTHYSSKYTSKSSTTISSHRNQQQAKIQIKK